MSDTEVVNKNKRHRKDKRKLYLESPCGKFFMSAIDSLGYRWYWPVSNKYLPIFLGETNCALSVRSHVQYFYQFSNIMNSGKSTHSNPRIIKEGHLPKSLHSQPSFPNTVNSIFERYGVPWLKPSNHMYVPNISTHVRTSDTWYLWRELDAHWTLYMALCQSEQLVRPTTRMLFWRHEIWSSYLLEALLLDKRSKY